MKFKLLEDLFDKNNNYNPISDSTFKKLLNKQINQLTWEDVKYIYAIWFAGNEYTKYNSIEDIYKEFEDIPADSDEQFKECANFLQNLTLPLTIYRGLNSKEIDSNQLNRNESTHWTVNPDIYDHLKNSNNRFSQCSKIICGELTDFNMINTFDTIINYMLYTNSKRTHGFGKFEITLKKRFNPDNIKNLRVYKNS